MRLFHSIRFIALSDYSIFIENLDLNLRKLYYQLPASWRFLARRVYYWPHDVLAQLRDQKVLVPPKGQIYTGSGNFEEQGRIFLRHFISYGQLKSTEDVLDIGSGIGRMAIPLTDFLDADSRYEGFDVIEKGVNWCIENITSKYPNFQFSYLPIHNDLYRNDGMQAVELTFPYQAFQFDFVILTSVFTHMLPDDMMHYIGEIDRVLRPGGRVFVTYFLLDEETTVLMKSGKSHFRFLQVDEHHHVLDRKVPSANVAYDKAFVFKAWKNKLFSLEHDLPGSWSGKSETIDFQDILVWTKPD